MKHTIRRTILFLIGLLAFPFVIWNITFGFIAGYVLLLLLVTGIFLSVKRKSLKAVLIAILTGFVSYIAMMPLTTVRMNKTTARYQERVSNGQDLNAIEKWNIYGINITASLVAYPFYPEASKEFLLMMFPSKNGLRTFESDFFMKSERLQAAFQKSNKCRVAWYQKHYNIHNPESRAALALNICTYEIKQTKAGTEYKVSVPVRYPVKCRSTFIKEPVEIRVEEGLFHYLEKEGWLFGYDAVWTFVDKTGH